MVHCDANGKVKEIGLVKIYCTSMGNAENESKSVHNYIKEKIVKLDERFCSLGQSLNYYINLKKILPEEYVSILARMRDMAKGTFPEYSVYAKNLVPCCSYCNSLKGSKFLSDSGKRMFISFYFDEMPQTSFLKIYIGIKDNIPYIEQFAIDFEEEKEVNEIIETHYAELKLFDRYKLPISNRLSSLFYELRTYEEYSVDKLKEVIELRIQTTEKIYGKNYWEVCLYKGVLKNEELLELLCEK